MNIILSTTEDSKAEQVKQIFEGSRFKIKTLDEMGITNEAPQDGVNLLENAYKKIQFAFDVLGSRASWVMAEATGLFIQYLDGAPGIHLNSWAGKNASARLITDHTLARLNGAHNRAAYFETVVVVANPMKHVVKFFGTAHGTILHAPRGEPQDNMPYSVIFVPNVSTQTWAEMTVERKNTISHRGKAFSQAKDFLEKFFQNKAGA